MCRFHEGQSQFAAEVYKRVVQSGHEVVGVFTIPDKNGREDALATYAAQDGVPVFKNKVTVYDFRDLDFFT